jgi:hypothetical protein
MALRFDFGPQTQGSMQLRAVSELETVAGNTTVRRRLKAADDGQPADGGDPYGGGVG